MTQTDPLADLKDIHLPADITWWPLAPGWWLLLLTIFVLMAAIYAFYHFVIKRRAYRKVALKELLLLETTPLDPDAYTEKVAAIIRRTALVTAKNNRKSINIAQLHGMEWRNYLQQAMPEEQANIIAIGRYKPLQTLDRAALFKATEQWIKEHKA